MVAFRISTRARDRGDYRNGLFSMVFFYQHFEFENSGYLSATIYDNKDDFSFKIINFPYLCSNIPSSSAYNVYISQLIRYTRTMTIYYDFLERHKYLRNKIMYRGMGKCDSKGL